MRPRRGHDRARTLDDPGLNPSIAADDEVITQRGDTMLHLALPPITRKVPFAQQLGEDAESVEQRADAARDQGAGEELAGGRERMNLPIANRTDGDQGHVEDNEQAPVLEEPIAEGPIQEDQAEQDGWQPEAEWGVRD